jgi:hypothetical protein
VVPRRVAVESRVAYLCWQDQAGGFAFTRADVLAMAFDEMDRYIATAEQRRRAYNDAVREANSPKRRR